jgi:hypothetical protein
MSKKFELNISDLRLICDPKIFKFKNTSEVKPLDTVIGQERAYGDRTGTRGPGN